MLYDIELSEKTRLQELQTVIKKNIRGFVLTGQALAEIRDSRLYRQKYHTFEDYCKYEWDMGKRYSSMLILSSDVVENLKQNGNLGSHSETQQNKINTNSANINPSETKILPANERQARPLTRLDPERQVEAWLKVIEAADGGRISAALVARIVQAVQDNKTDKEIGKIKERIDTENIYTRPFKVGFQAFLDVVCDARDKNWKENSKKAVIKHIDELKKLIIED